MDDRLWERVEREVAEDVEAGLYQWLLSFKKFNFIVVVIIILFLIFHFNYFKFTADYLLTTVLLQQFYY